MKERLPKIFLIFLGILILLNLVFLDFQLFFKKEEPEPKPVSLPSADYQSLSENGAERQEAECSLDCQGLIDQKIAAALSGLPSPFSEKKSSSVPTSSQNSAPKIAYVPICSEGSSVSLAWENIVSSEFHFDLNDYPGAREVRLVASLRAVNSSAQVSARLYDQTNYRGVDYSDLISKGSDFKTIESSGITIWRGNNKYLVQLKSADGNEVQLKEAKLKISF